MLIVTGGQGEPYAVLKPFKLPRPAGSVLAKEYLFPSHPFSGSHPFFVNADAHATCIPYFSLTFGNASHLVTTGEEVRLASG
jgi:hypothetical protein